MTATGPSWLLIVGGIALLVIFSGRASAIWNWLMVKFEVRSKDAPPEEIQLIVDMVKASKTITDKDQKQKVVDACVACFMGWLNAEVQPEPPPV